MIMFVIRKSQKFRTIHINGAGGGEEKLLIS